MKTIDSCERNEITLDAFYGYVIQKGIPVHLGITAPDYNDRIETNNRVIVVLTLSYFGQERYAFIGMGLTLGHALQELHDNIERDYPH